MLPSSLLVEVDVLVVRPSELVVVLPSVVEPRSLLVVLESLPEDVVELSSVELELVVVPLPTVSSSSFS